MTLLDFLTGLALALVCWLGVWLIFVLPVQESAHKLIKSVWRTVTHQKQREQ